VRPPPGEVEGPAVGGRFDRRSTRRVATVWTIRARGAAASGRAARRARAAVALGRGPGPRPARRRL